MLFIFLVSRDILILQSSWPFKTSEIFEDPQDLKNQIVILKIKFFIYDT